MMKKLTKGIAGFLAAVSVSSSAAAYRLGSLPALGGDSFDNREQYEKACIWAQALADRDGLQRYKIMTDDMRRRFVEEQKEYICGEDWNFVIGYSSPFVTGFNITSFGDTAFITYHQADSSGETYSISEKLTFTGEKGSRLVASSEAVWQ